MKEKYEKLDYAERWLVDGLSAGEPPGFFEIIEVDMTRSKKLIEQWRYESQIKITYTHLIVRAVAMALERHRELHQVVMGQGRLYPGTIDINLSVAGTTFVAPIMKLEDVGAKTLPEIGTEIITRAPDIRKEDIEKLVVLRQWGKVIPLKWLRRLLLRFLVNQRWFHQQVIGKATFQISCVPTVDIFVPFMLGGTSATLGVGHIGERVMAIDGQPQVRTTVNLSCTFDHKVWDGMRAAIFLNELKKILESGEIT